MFTLEAMVLAASADGGRVLAACGDTRLAPRGR